MQGQGPPGPPPPIEQIPDMHVDPGPCRVVQFIPQEPQFIGSAFVSTLQPFACRVLVQLAQPGMQVLVQEPDPQESTETLVDEQAIPHPPQLAVSVWVSTQVLAHIMLGGMHVIIMEQMPPVHV